MDIDASIPKLNNEQSQAAYSESNTVVAAGAGSGKTMVLASRYTWLITEKKIKVREILSLTFTKKAAAQMYQRIHLLLTEIANKDNTYKKTLAKEALEDFSQARIQTLDSYCASIVRQASNRYGLSPNFNIDEERCTALSLETAITFLLKYRDHPALKVFYPHKRPLKIADDIFAYVLFYFSGYEVLMPAMENFLKQSQIISKEWGKQVNAIKEMLRNLEEVYRGNEQYHPDLAAILLKLEIKNIYFTGEDELKDYFDKISALDHRECIKFAENDPLQTKIFNFIEAVALFTSLNLNKGSPKINPAKEIIKELRAIFGGFSSLGVYCLQAGFIYSLLQLIEEIQQDYLVKKRKEGILTFNDTARLARNILMEQKDIRTSEKQSFKAIMIDEFQDNNELQKDILFLIAEKDNICNDTVPQPENLSPSKLFFVGDEKQSIYRFRGADVSVFRKLNIDLGSKELPLKINYRSSPSLIGAFNAIFGGSSFDPLGKDALATYPSVFIPKDPDLPPYEASYTALQANKTKEGKLNICIAEKGDNSVENEARFVAEKISKLLDTYKPHDIAILFRSRTHQHTFEKHLLLLNIPYTSENLNGFFYGSPVNDLMSVLRLAAYPGDRAAYAEMLRSPFCGLSLQGLSYCISELDNSDLPFGDFALELLSSSDREKYINGKETYEKVSVMAAENNICSILNYLWYNSGYRYETEWNTKTSAYKELFDYLFHLAVKADENNQSLAAFTDYINRFSALNERLDNLEIPMERGSAVKLMTVHKSKGLEFPVVFLCCCDRRGKYDTSDDIFEIEGASLGVNPPLPEKCLGIKDIKRNYFWEISSATESRKRIAELRRLLYVGMTRAEDLLYLSGTLDIDEIENVDFPLLLNQYIETKIKKSSRKNDHPLDSILEGSTFFGLCLPAIGAHIQENNKNSFLNIEKIPVYEDERFTTAIGKKSEITNDQKGLETFLQKSSVFYTDKEVLNTQILYKNYYSPSKLINDDSTVSKFIINKENSGADAKDVFVNVDKLMIKYDKDNREDGEKFDAASFGTIAHLCVEALLKNNEEIVIPPKIAGFLNPIDMETFKKAGIELAQRFINSPLGKKAKNSEKIKNEFSYRYLTFDKDGNEFFINGIIDLIYEYENEVRIVDFKTDSVENAEVHIAQMSSYYNAIKDVFSPKKDIQTWLYYLRTGHAVNMTEAARDFDLINALIKSKQSLLHK